jgi:hypothetical protein
MTDSLLEIAPCSIILMMEAVTISKTSVSFYETTWRSIPVQMKIVCGFGSVKGFGARFYL